MDLTPLYELRDRLRAGVIAGAALAADDFRLWRAVEALAPLEKASPVFARLGTICRALLAPDCPAPVEALLDAITLADAILCTQGAVAVSGTVEPLEVTSTGSALTNAPYSVLAPLQEALTTSGNGKYSFVVDTHDQRPELFQDYRVQGALVQALGAGYAELADKAEQWLAEMGEPVLPLLKNGFDPKGKKDMVRRVRTIEAIAGAKANDFYLSQIPEAEKDVRAVLVYALRHDEGNAEKLIELTKTEKGPAKKMAFWALARMECAEAQTFWLQSEKTRALAVQYGPMSTSPAISDAVAEALGKWLEPFEADQDAHLSGDDLNALVDLLFALMGKSGPAICGIYRRLAAIGPVMDKKPEPFPNKKSKTLVLRPMDRFGPQPRLPFGELVPFSEAIPQVLRRSIQFHPTPDLMALAEELRNTVSAAYASVGLTAALTSKPAAEAFELAKPYLRIPPNIFGKPKVEVLRGAFDTIRWDEKLGHVTQIMMRDPADGRSDFVIQPLAEPLDRRWYKALIDVDKDGSMGWRLARITPLHDAELCYQAAEHLYKLAINGIGNDANRLRSLRELGWNKCEGLAVRLCKSKRVNIWELRTFFAEMPGDAEQRKAEALRVYNMALKGNVSFASAWKPESLILQLEKEINELFPGSIKE